MDNKADQNGRTAEEAARALRQLGWMVYPHDNEGGAWQIGDAILSDDGLIKFAAWAPKSGRVGWISSGEPPKRNAPNAPLEAAEALECIRAVMGVMIAPTVDDEAAAYRLIRAITKKASHTSND